MKKVLSSGHESRINKTLRPFSSPTVMSKSHKVMKVLQNSMPKILLIKLIKDRFQAFSFKYFQAKQFSLKNFEDTSSVRICAMIS